MSGDMSNLVSPEHSRSIFSRPWGVPNPLTHMWDIWKRWRAPPLSPPRTIYINNPARNGGFCHNRISTTKYSIVTFIPRFLYDQFRRYANVFFLLIASLQQIPGVSPTGRFTTAIPLLLVLLATAVKEIIEDLRRYKADNKENGRKVWVYRESQLSEHLWTQVVVGDIIKVTNKAFIPADLLLLTSSEPQGICYIETSNLDGETNLKIRQPCSAIPHHGGGQGQGNHGNDKDAQQQLLELMGQVHCEGPNSRLYEFTGRITCDGSGDENTTSLNANQILLRGAQLRNTDWIYGLVIYTGHDTKLMRNSTKAPLKRSNLDHVTNRQVFLIFLALLVLALISTALSTVWNAENSNLYYLQLPSGSGATAGQFFLNFLTFIVLYNNLIPISLIVTVELVKYIQAFYINNDQAMYDPETDTPATARNSNLNEELGQVKYIFSDKTGTLTQNIMEFKSCSINGHVYRIGAEDLALEDGHTSSRKDGHTSFYEDGQPLPGAHATPLQDVLGSRHEHRDEVMEFLKVLAICHSVIPEQTEEGVAYRASSPDEQALVEAARSLGIIFNHRTPDSLAIDVMGTKEEYEVLNLLEFSSARKRMSVIVRTPDGTIKLFCKGADSVIYERLSPDQPLAEVTDAHLKMFASSGLRTLCISEATLKEREYKEWQSKYHQASITIENREVELEEVSNMIEKDLSLLGATAIEDKLQENVPESIETLRKANIKIWVLTGDKRETAINIGHSSRQLTSTMLKHDLCTATNVEEAKSKLESFINELQSSEKGKKDAKNEKTEAALIVDGKTLEYALHPQTSQLFLSHALACKSVICCRVSPSQKAAVVELVKSKVKNSITLAIGDGANDVAMIQAAHVGVGISGREGLQATLASDYAIAQFRFLVRLLLVHGAWNYNRLSKLVPYCFYKNITLYLISFWFAFYNGFSGQPIFERWTLALYNVIFTSIPPFVLGLFDQDVTADGRLRIPSLYVPSQSGKGFNTKVFWMWIGMAIFHSAALFFIIFYGLQHESAVANGQVVGMWYIGSTIYAATVITVTLKAALESEYWTWVTHVAIWGSIASWFLFLVTYSHLWPTFPVGVEMFGLDYVLYSTFVFYLSFVLGPGVCMLPDLIWKSFKHMLRPSEVDIAKSEEIEEKKMKSRSCFIKGVHLGSEDEKKRLIDGDDHRGYSRIEKAAPETAVEITCKWCCPFLKPSVQQQQTNKIEMRTPEGDKRIEPDTPKTEVE
eukprot:Em0022g433a